MTRDEIKDQIRARIPLDRYLKKSKGKQYICPYCGSGTGEHGTGALTCYPDTHTFYCFVCRKSGDVLDLYQQAQGCDFNAALHALAQELHLPLSEGEAPAKGLDYAAYYRACQARLSEPQAIAYLTQRGIAVKTAQRYGIGFDPIADPASAPGGIGPKNHPCPRLILPTSPTHYIARSVDPRTPKAYVKMNPKGSPAELWNVDALDTQEPQDIFVCEGVFDALSVIEAGKTAIALNSITNANVFLDRLKQKQTAARFYLCLDNDKAGNAAAKTLQADLARLSIPSVPVDLCGGKKDPNEYWQADKEGFLRTLETLQLRPIPQTQPQDYALIQDTGRYIDTHMTDDILAFQSVILTGYENLDAKAGGLYSGLYCLAAISSLGKTTFAAQMADQIAAAGIPVLFFSLEQSRLELVSKSISRLTAKNDITKAVTSLNIRYGTLTESVLQAAQQYKQEVIDHHAIIEGNFNCTASFIMETIQNYMETQEKKPVVFIDYLQIIQPEAPNGRQTVRETIDQNVTALKKFSRDKGITIFVISSVNRLNYSTPIDLDSLKESGGIEYTCDVIWGLQLRCVSEAQNEPVKRAGLRETIKEEKAKTPRRVELVCVKNRYGISNFSVYFDYYPAWDWFQENREGISFDGGYPNAPSVGLKRLK